MASSSPQTTQQLFSGGREMSNLMLSSGILQKGWDSISEIQQLPNKIHHLKSLPKVNIFAFGSLDRHQPPPASPPLQKLDKDHPLGFLITKDNPDISLHQSPLSIFESLFEELKQQLKELTDKNKNEQRQLVLVGQSLGGSVAALFALWLLKNRSSLSLPICITYGSPFLGDEGLQKAINKVDQWKAQFWHVADIRDPEVPRIPPWTELKPFGTYLLCSDSGSTCISDPESVLALLQATTGAENHHTNYRDRLKQLKEKITSRDGSSSIEQIHDPTPLRVGLAMQLEAVGVRSTDSGHQKLLSDMEEREKDEFVRKNSVPNPSRRLNDVKKQMARLEWYMKWCEDNGKEYYECFKSRSTEKDIDVIRIKNVLNKYWKEMVEKSETEPQTKDVQLRDRWLFSGTNYRRIVEPLDIAEYYRKPSNRDYMNKGRSEHYKKLEAWQKEADRPKVKDKAPSLTEDSCFWAQVEEATIKLAELKKPELDQGQHKTITNELKRFEEYVGNMVMEREVSPKVFTIPHNPFLKWWEDYKGFLQPGYQSSLGNIINNPNQYK